REARMEAAAPQRCRGDAGMGVVPVRRRSVRIGLCSALGRPGYAQCRVAAALADHLRPRPAYPAGQVRIMKRLLVFVCVLVAILLFPKPASAHPLGNFSVNHSVTLTFSRSSVTASVVIDFAELPTLAAKPTADLSGRTLCREFAQTFSVSGLA